MHHTYLRHTSIWELPARRDYSALLKKVLSIRDVIVHRQGSVEQAIACVQSWQKGSRVAHAYDYFRHRAQNWAQIIWKPFIPPKSSFVLWLGQRGRLLTRERLDFLHIDQTCGFCGLEIETVRHLFFTCPMSRAIWQPVRAWTRMRREMNTLEAAVKWLRKEARGTTVPARVRRLSFACTVYYIWLSRNRMFFDGLQPSPKEIVHRIQTQVYRVLYSMYPSVSLPSS